MKTGKSGFSLIELIITVAILALLVVALMTGLQTMISTTEFGNHEFLAANAYRQVQIDIMTDLMQAENNSIVLSGNAQQATLTVSETYGITATVSVYPQIEYRVPVGIDPSDGTLVYSDDADASTFLVDPNHELAPYIPCTIRIRRDANSGAVVKEYVTGAANPPNRIIGHCDQFHAWTDVGGAELPGLGFYQYPIVGPESVTVLLSVTEGTSENDPLDPSVQFADQFKIIPKN